MRNHQLSVYNLLQNNCVSKLLVFARERAISKLMKIKPCQFSTSRLLMGPQPNNLCKFVCVEHVVISHRPRTKMGLQHRLRIYVDFDLSLIEDSLC